MVLSAKRPSLPSVTSSCAHGAEALPRLRVVKADAVDDVVRVWKPTVNSAFVTEEVQAVPGAREVAAEDPALLRLLELVAVHGVVEEVGEVREQVEVVVDAVDVQLVEPRCRRGAASVEFRL